MSDIAHFFAPVNPENFSSSFPNSSLFNKSRIHNIEDGFPDLEGVHFAFFYVNEARGAITNKKCSNGGHNVRHFLYNLYVGAFEPIWADLGNIEPGHSIEDTYFALAEACEFLLKKNIIPIIIGGSQDLTFGQFKGYQNLEQTINMVAIDSMFDLGAPEDETNNHSYLGKIILHQPNFLFNFSNIGYQSYLVDPNALSMMTKLYFDTYRLGHFRNNIPETEPIIRHADMMSIDLNALKHCDSPAHSAANPNGFYAEEICQMMRYAGMNDKMSSLGIYEYNPELDVNGKSAHLISQMIWCFMDGYYNRKNDFPSRAKQEYTRFHVFLQDNKYEINFYKSSKSDRWWMEVPYPTHQKLKFERHTLIPCSYKDYEIACKDEIPDRWWQTYQKLS